MNEMQGPTRSVTVSVTALARDAGTVLGTLADTVGGLQGRYPGTLGPVYMSMYDPSEWDEEGETVEAEPVDEEDAVEVEGCDPAEDADEAGEGAEDSGVWSDRGGIRVVSVGVGPEHLDWGAADWLGWASAHVSNTVFEAGGQRISDVKEIGFRLAKVAEVWHPQWRIQYAPTEE